MRLLAEAFGVRALQRRFRQPEIILLSLDRSSTGMPAFAAKRV
jgi:hypothetical protein